VLKIVKEPISLATPIGDEEESSLDDFVEDELAPSPVEAAIQGNLGEQTRKMLATLTPREEQILRMRFGIGQKTDYTLEEVGKQFAVTRERIRQIEAKAPRKLRQTGRSRNLEGFMERAIHAKALLGSSETARLPSATARSCWSYIASLHPRTAYRPPLSHPTRLVNCGY
jgi:hypothetical protein